MQDRLDPIVFGLCLIAAGSKFRVDLPELLHDPEGFVSQTFPMARQDMIEIMIGEETLIGMPGSR
jgi:hypothetical protein